jgi:microcystin-dependent protein
MPGVFQWSQTANNNGSADPSVGFLENQAPSSLNDGCRALMASTARWRDDIGGGALVTTGSPSAYAVISNQGFDTRANFHQKMICFVPHVTNTAVVTMTVDGFANIPLRSAPGVELPAGVLIAGTPYGVTFSNTDGALYLHGFFGNPYNVPLGAGLDHWLPLAPSSSFAFAIGQAISRTTYSTLFNGPGGSGGMGTTFGAGDGSTTFNLPDKRGRVSAAWDAMGGGGSAGRLSPAFGGVTGTETITLGAAQIPGHTHSGTTGNDSPDHTHTYSTVTAAANSLSYGGGPNFGLGGNFFANSGGASARHAHAFTTDAGAGLGGAAHNNTQPTIVCNYIIRII